MNRTALRAPLFAGAAFTLTAGLMAVPTEVAAQQAAPASVEICNSGASTPGQKIWVHTGNWPNGYALFPGGCGTFQRVGTVKVHPEGVWNVRSVPGEYGQCWASFWSYPGSKAKYSYRIGC